MGVKQLWTLLSPVGRPVPLESLEGKILAIDSSIWLYQFQATMRDKDGRALVNAHILGFLRRISKLLFYGIKPVFVFDGGAPVLKRNTIAERKKRKSGAAASHAKVAEKLLAAQLRREALRHAEEHDKRGPTAVSPPKGKQPANTTGGDENYLDDLSGPLIVLPGKHNAPFQPNEPSTSSTNTSKAKPTPTSTSPTKKNFRDHDPYHLPELTDTISARAQPNDPRLATDEELRAYVSHLRPDDPEFHELPADAQYEILGELRLKSRTTSHRRLQKMLRQSKTPMDFSMAQIRNLGQRNRLTQEVLSTLDLVGTGTGGVVVPVKIASEKNREYVLIRNEGVDGGFTLGMRQQGNTADKPIVVEEEDEEGDDSFDSKANDSWEDIVVPGRTQIGVAPDQDWRDYKRENALAGLSKRDTDKHLAPLTTKTSFAKPRQPTALDKGKGKATDAAPLDKGKGKAIDPDPYDDDSGPSDLEDAVLQYTMNASLAAEAQADEDEEADLQRALALSLADQDQDGPGASSGSGGAGFGMSYEPDDTNFGSNSELFGARMFGAPTGLFGAPTGLLDGADPTPSSPHQVVDGVEEEEDEDMDMEEVVVNVPPIIHDTGADLEWEDFEVTTPPITSPRILSPKISSPSQTARTGKPKTPAHTASPLSEPTSRRTSATRRELAQALTSSGDEDDEGEDVPLPSRLMTILAPYQTGGVGGSPVKKASEATPPKVAIPKHETPSRAGSVLPSPTKKAQSSGGAIPSKRVAWSNVSPVQEAPKVGSSTVKAPSTLPTSVPEKTSTTPLNLSDEDMEELVVEPPAEKLKDVPSTLQTGDEATAEKASMPSWFTSAPTVGVSAPPKRDILAELTQDVDDFEYEEGPKDAGTKGSDAAGPSEMRIQEDKEPADDGEPHELTPIELSDEDEDEIPVAWSRSPTPSGARSPVAVPVHTEPDFDSARSRTSRLQAEDEEHATFMSTLQGKSYATMRESLDAEIAALRKERAAALRDAEDITAQMSAQIQVLLRLFGVPFLNAPMEAEAQCAFLAQRGLVEGVITDDSDVFLFGAGRVFRNMFNQSKTVECFLAADLERELGLDRETLIGLAYLLGSDYTEGLAGVGPVVAMEIMKEFPGQKGLDEFRDWWRKVQVGKDTEADLRSTFRKRFKKKFKTLHLTEEWPNAKVREAYLDPAVDQSEERFQWGLPDLDGLRQFLGEELLWNASKVDETLLPIIRRMTQRTNAAGANRQGTLTSFLDVTGNPTSNGVTHAPRKRQAYASKRLQQVVSEYRARKAGEDVPDEEDEAESEGGSKAKRKAKPRAKPKGKAKAADDAESQDSGAGAGAAGSKRKRAVAGSTRGAGRGRARGARGAGRGARGAGRGRGRGRGQASAKADAEEEELASDAGSRSGSGEPEAEAPTPKKPRLRPRMKKPSPAPQAADSEEGSGSSDEYVES